MRVRKQQTLGRVPNCIPPTNGEFGTKRRARTCVNVCGAGTRSQNVKPLFVSGGIELRLLTVHYFL